MPQKKIDKIENIFIVKSDELKVMMRKYNIAFPNAIPSLFNSSMDTIKGVDLSGIKKKLTKHIDFSLDNYNLYDGPKKNPELYLSYELADVYCVMAHMIGNEKNLLTDGKKIVTPGPALVDISEFNEYNDEILKGIDILPAQIKGYVKQSPGYKDHSTLSKYLSEITERFIVLLSSVVHSNHYMNIIIDKLDDFINDLIPYTNKNVHEHKPDIPVYFDKLFSDIFKEIGEITLSQKSSNNDTYKETHKTHINEKHLMDAWKKYNARLKYLRENYKETYLDRSNNEPTHDIIELLGKKANRGLYYDPYEFLSFFLITLRQNDIISKDDYRLKNSGIESLPLRIDIANLLNSAYASVDKYEELYIEEYVHQDDNEEIAEYLRIFDEINSKSETFTKMKEKKNYKYKKFFREIYLASFGMRAKSVCKKENFKKEKLLEAKWLFPYFYKIFITSKNKRKQIIEEIEKEFIQKFYNEEDSMYVVEQAYETFCGYKGLVKYSLLLFVLFDFMTRIRKSEMKSSKFLPIVESTVEDKLRIINLSREEIRGLYNYRTLDYFERKLDWKNILSDENYLKFYELKEDTIRSGPFKAYYFKLKEGADNIIENIKEYDGTDFTPYLGLLGEDIEDEANAFLEETYIAEELSNARKYFEYKNRSSFINEIVRSIMGGAYRDIAKDEMNIQ